MAVAIIVAVSSLCFAADRKQLETAVAAVDANLKTPAGKQYDADFGKDFQKYMPNLRACKQSGTLVDFDMFLQLQTDGKVEKGLIHPETPYTNCVRDSLLSGRFSPPPHGDYWVNVHTQFKK